MHSSAGAALKTTPKVTGDSKLIAMTRRFTCCSALLVAFLAWLSILLPVGASGGRFTPVPSDGRLQQSCPYDAALPASLAYDFTPALSQDESEHPAVGTDGAFVDYAGFLAAKAGANLTKAELDKLYPRITPRRGLADEVWERSKAPNGKVYDPSGVEIKPGDYWELGHTPGNKFSDAQRRAAEQGWDRSTWRQYQNDPDIYRPEMRPTNRSHRHESDW